MVDVDGSSLSARLTAQVVWLDLGVDSNGSEPWWQRHKYHHMYYYYYMYVPRFTWKIAVKPPHLCMCRKYSIERQTSRFAINYYVRPDFEESYADGSLELTRLERQVEDEYISTLQHNCYRERSYRKSLRLSLSFIPHCIVISLMWLGLYYRVKVYNCN